MHFIEIMSVFLLQLGRLMCHAYRIVHKWRSSIGFTSVQCQNTGPKAARKLTSKVKDWTVQQSVADNTFSGPQLATKFKQELNFNIQENNSWSYQLESTWAIVYWDDCYFKTNIVARRAQAPKGKACCSKAKPIPKDKAKKQDKSKEFVCVCVYDIFNPLTRINITFLPNELIFLNFLSPNSRCASSWGEPDHSRYSRYPSCPVPCCNRNSNAYGENKINILLQKTVIVDSSRSSWKINSIMPIQTSHNSILPLFKQET